MFVRKLFGNAGKKIVVTACALSVAAAQDKSTDLTQATEYWERAQVGDENAALFHFNAAQLTLKAGASDKAGPMYVPILGSQLPPALRSVALSNFATIKAERDKDTATAISYLKKALKEDPGNEFARYNYEALSQRTSPPPPPPPSDSPPDPKPDSGLSPENTGEVPKPRPISQAEAILAIDAYRRREAQYLQQLRKKTAFNPYLNQSLW